MGRKTHRGFVRRRQRWLIAAVIAAVAVGIVTALAGGAFADNTISDGDNTTPVAASPLAFGTVCINSTTNGGALVAIGRNGNGTNTFQNSASVAVSVLSVSGTGLSASMGSPATITLPSNWTGLSNNTMSDAVSSQVTLVAGPSAGSFSGSVTYRATGKNTDGTTINRDATMAVSATVSNTGPCSPTPPDTTPPTVTVSLPSPVSGLNGWFNAADVTPVVGSVTASDASNVSNISCTGATLSGVSGYGTNTASGTLTVSGDGTHHVSCTATDGASNTGAAAGSNNTSTIKIDTSAPTTTDAGFASGTAGNNGWYVSPVTENFTASDATSGLADCSSSFTQTSGSEGSAVTIPSGSCSDKAGNINTGIHSPSYKIDLTAPTVDCSAPTPDYAGGGGWYASNKSVSCSASDGLSGLAGSSSFSLGPTTIGSDNYGSQTLGPQSVSDKAGNSSSTGSFPLQIDRQAPIGGSVSYADGYNTSGTVHVGRTDATDPGSGIASNVLQSRYGTLSGGSCDFSGGSWAAVTLDGSGNDTVASGNCAEYRLVATDNVSNQAIFDSPNVVKVDTTPPTITLDHYDPAANGNTAANGVGWNKTSVTVYWNCSDSASGVANPSVSQSVTTEGYNQKATGTCTNGAALTASDDEYVNIDETAPTVSVTGVANAATYTLGHVPTAGCNTTDAPSGVQSGATLTTSGGPVGSLTAICSGGEDKAGNVAAPVSVTYSVTYNWTGFFQPINNMPTVNTVQAGSGVPVKFSLSGYQGLSIFATGYPQLVPITCGTLGTLPTDSIETTTAGNSSLTYDFTSDQYTYVWKTQKPWAGTCGRLDVKLTDGTTHSAYFNFKK